jgi:hypothetical protein
MREMRIWPPYAAKMLVNFFLTWPLPAFELLRVKDYNSCGTLNLPPYIDPYDAFAIFKLFFTDKILDKLIEWTNKYAELYLLRRILLPICKEESYTCFRVLIHMGITIESAIEDCWGLRARWRRPRQIECI